MNDVKRIETSSAQIHAELSGMAAADGDSSAFLASYLDTLSMVERLHRLLLDVIKDEFERLQVIDINPVQALLLFNVGDAILTAGELRSRGYYQGSNVSYNLKKLVEAGYMHHERCAVDRRAVRVRLTERGTGIRALVGQLFERHAQGIQRRNVLPDGRIGEINADLRGLEAYWTEQIRYIY